MVVLVLPGYERGGQLVRCLEGGGAGELLGLRRMAPLDLPVAVRVAPGDVQVADARVMQVPGEVGPELGAVVGLDPLDGHRESLAQFPHEGDGRLDGGVVVDRQDALAAGLIGGRVLVQAPGPEPQRLRVDIGPTASVWRGT